MLDFRGVTFKRSIVPIQMKSATTLPSVSFAETFCCQHPKWTILKAKQGHFTCKKNEKKDDFGQMIRFHQPRFSEIWPFGGDVV